MKSPHCFMKASMAKKIAKWQLGYMLGMVVGLRETSGMRSAR